MGVIPCMLATYKPSYYFSCKDRLSESKVTIYCIANHFLLAIFFL
jgi:hypothetical protein